MPTKIHLLLTAAVLCLTAALFVSGPGFAARFLFAFAAGLILSGLGLRFKKAAGIPLLVLFTAGLILGGLSRPGWETARFDQSACRVVVLSLEPETALSITTRGETETIVHAPSSSLRLKTEFLAVPAAYLLFSALPVYRVTALLAGDEQRSLAAAKPAAAEKLLLALPGVHLQTFETPLPPLELFSSYELFVDPRQTAPPYFK
jgi:hypothetical protein